MPSVATFVYGADADELGEAEGEVEDANGGALRRERGLQEREAERRGHLGAERHRDEEDVGRLGTGFVAASSNQATNVPGGGPDVKAL